MSVMEMFPAVKDLPRADKLRLMQFIAQELVDEEEAILELKVGVIYPLWTPQDIPNSAAETLADWSYRNATAFYNDEGKRPAR